MRKSVTEKNSVIISGQLIPWSFVWRVHRLCGRNWDDTIDCFWKAKCCTGENGIQRYIMSGLRKGRGGERWMLVPSRERWDGKMEGIRQWWEGLYRRRERRDDGGNDGAIEAMLAELTAKMGLSAAIDRKAKEGL
jgi:hypothetical protein